jgi:hypothetical protein
MGRCPSFDRALSVLVGGHVRFLCRPGMIGNRIAVRVSDVIDQYPLHVEDDTTIGPVAAPEPGADALAVGALAGGSDAGSHD